MTENKYKDWFEDAGGSYCKLKEGHVKNITTEKYKQLQRVAPKTLLMDVDVIFDILDRLQILEKRIKIK